MWKKYDLKNALFSIADLRRNETFFAVAKLPDLKSHGRLAMYKYGTNDVVFVLEDGIEKSGRFQVRSRMIIKKSTLLKWIDIIEAGPDKLNESEEKAK